jgi:hypothetical protein
MNKLNLENYMDNNNFDIDDDNNCLISYTTLEKNHVTLECSHKFNYKHLYEEIKKQKTLNNCYEIQRLKKHQIKCPYCRQIQDKLLPYPRDSNYPKIIGVNSPLKYCMNLNRCRHIFKSGKNKGTQCTKKIVDNYCATHLKYQDRKICTHIYTKGKNKNKQCQRFTKKDTILCTIHTKKIDT